MARGEWVDVRRCCCASCPRTHCGSSRVGPEHECCPQGRPSLHGTNVSVHVCLRSASGSEDPPVMTMKTRMKILNKLRPWARRLVSQHPCEEMERRRTAYVHDPDTKPRSETV